MREIMEYDVFWLREYLKAGWLFQCERKEGQMA